jgi:hypothetical protein
MCFIFNLKLLTCGLTGSAAIPSDARSGSLRDNARLFLKITAFRPGLKFPLL